MGREEKGGGGGVPGRSRRGLRMIVALGPAPGAAETPFPVRPGSPRRIPPLEGKSRRGCSFPAVG